MDWIPIAFLAFKFLALATAMFFAIKWHYDQGEKGDRKALLRVGLKMATIFLLTVVCVGGIAFAASWMLGLDLSIS